jgi:amidase
MLVRDVGWWHRRPLRKGLRMTDDTRVCWLPVREQAALIRTRALSATELVSLHLDRIGALNPALNAIVTP